MGHAGSLVVACAAVCKFLVVAFGIYFPDQGFNLGPVPWEHAILTTGPPEKFLVMFF